MSTLTFAPLLDQVDSLLEELDDAVTRHRDAIARVAPSNRASAINLVHYLALRGHDLRPLQMELARLGLSSLGRSEGRVWFSVAQVRARLREAMLALGTSVTERPVLAEVVTPASAEGLIHRNAQALFGPKPTPRHVYIMVTLPDSREVTPAWARALLVAGTNCVRINTAHDDAAGWERAIRTIRQEAAQLGRDVRVLVDLEGPKLRTLPLGPGVCVHKLRPPKDELGRFAGALAVELGSGEASPTTIPIPDELRAQLRLGDELKFRDARGKKRALMVSAVHPDQIEALLQATAYLTDETELVLRRDRRELARFHPGPLPRVETSVGLAVDDQFWLADPAAPAGSARGFLEVQLSLPEVLRAVEVGHRVFVDDGRLEAVVVEVDPQRILCRVVRTPTSRFRLRGEMGINLPDTATGVLAAMSDKDRVGLEFALAHADMVGLSFVREPGDVQLLRERLAAAPRPIGLVLKIETSSGFRNLGDVLLEALRHHPVAIMIARGDLAVEVGFERLAELQEEILWLCEAAHVPVIWATQVLESLAKTGLPSRAEVTDAAMGVRAECVMLNKGAYVSRAVETLASILQRMESHTYKKMALYRELAFR